jgi:hypothetical protein
MPRRKVQVPFGVGKVLSDGDDRNYPDRLRPFEHLASISVEQGVAQMGMGIYKATAGHGR